MALAALFALASLVTPASAAPNDAETRSRALYAEGEALANNGNWKDACPLFQAAHDLHGTGGTALRTADCYEKVSKYDRALDLYQWIVDHRDTDKQPERVVLAQNRVVALRKQLGVDQQGEPVPPPAPASGTVVTPPPPPPPMGKPNRVPAYALFGVAGAGLVVGAVAGGLALGQASTLKSMCPTSAPCPQGADNKSGALTKAWVSNVGFGVAIVGAVVGVVLFATAKPSVTADVKSAVGPEGLTLHF